MIARTVLFLFPLLLILLPIFLYKKDRPKLVTICYRLAFDHNGLKMVVKSLAVVIFFFHSVCYMVFPKDMGYFFSIPILLILLLCVNKSVKALLAIRRNNYLYCALVLLTILLLFIPRMFSITYTLAAMLECANIFPAKGLEDFCKRQSEDEDVDKKFINAYFS